MPPPPPPPPAAGPAFPSYLNLAWANPPDLTIIPSNIIEVDIKMSLTLVLESVRSMDISAAAAPAQSRAHTVRYMPACLRFLGDWEGGLA